MDTNSVLYDQIGAGYNSTRQADPFIVQRLLELLSPQKDKLYLDIGCGTGNYTIPLAEKGFKFSGVEPSAEMLDTARQRNSDINWVNGSAEQIPVSNHTFDGAIATLTIHHWSDLNVAFKELNRALKPNTNFIIFTALPMQMESYWLNYYFSKMMVNAIEQMPSWQMIETAANEAGFAVSGTDKYFVGDELKDHFLYAGKHKPEIYLYENIRKGISSFAALANLKEVEAGLFKMKDDIATGHFEAIKNNFNNDKGDYLFIKLNKK
jgi:ubiquinone/menaquinone biosynthesis C-methylase UbiE